MSVASEFYRSYLMGRKLVNRDIFDMSKQLQITLTKIDIRRALVNNSPIVTNGSYYQE